MKAGTPTMGGLIIIFTTLVPVLLLQNCIYIVAIRMGTIGFIDDYIKILKRTSKV
jgi:phospho-N-acetylmuramoyl-pentapeptide-transferase